MAVQSFKKLFIVLVSLCIITVLFYRNYNLLNFRKPLNSVFGHTLANPSDNGSTVQPSINTTNKEETSTVNCDNVLKNMTQGKWVGKASCFEDKTSSEYQELMKLEEEVDAHLNKFRILRGIHTRLWRSDLKCGYKNLQKLPNGSEWTPVASWCNKKAVESCCSGENDGLCVDPSTVSDCKCPGCFDMKKILHAEVSKWIPSDTRCRYKTYDASEACHVMEKFDKIYFVGDSLLRKFFRAFVLVVTSDHDKGAFMTNFSPEMKKLCTGYDQFYWKECAINGGALRKLVNKTTLCGGKGAAAFEASIMLSYRQVNSANFLNLVRRLAGKSRSLVIFGAGLHMQCNPKVALEYFFDPLVTFKNNYFNTTSNNSSYASTLWPHIIFVPPDPPGILKPPAYFQKQGKQACSKYSDEIKKFCSLHNIPVLEFAELCRNIHSYDGTHYGFAVNMMKVQMLLNYVETL